MVSGSERMNGKKRTTTERKRTRTFIVLFPLQTILEEFISSGYRSHVWLADGRSGQDAFGVIAPGASVFVQSCYNHGLKIRQEKKRREKRSMSGFEMRVPSLAGFGKRRRQAVEGRTSGNIKRGLHQSESRFLMAEK